MCSIPLIFILAKMFFKISTQNLSFFRRILFPPPSIFISALISAILSLQFSQILFNRQTLVWLYKFQNWLMHWTNILSEMEAAKLQKMYNLWSPPTHPFPYLAHSLAVILTLRGISSDRPPCPLSLRNSFCLAISTTIWMVASQRVGEINLLVICLNFIHSAQISTVIGLIDWIILTKIE